MTHVEKTTPSQVINFLNLTFFWDDPLDREGVHLYKTLGVGSRI